MTRRINVGGGQLQPLSSQVKTAAGVVVRPRRYSGGPAGSFRDLSQWPFSWDDPFNIGIGNGATWSGSADAITAFAQGGAGGGVVNGVQQNVSYSIPVYVADVTSPVQTIGSATMQVPAGALGATGTDGHATIVQPKQINGSYQAYGEYRLVNTGAAAPNTYTALAGGGPNDLSQYSWHYDGRASSIMQIAGLIRPYDITNRGEILHAIAMALPAASMTTGYIWPASSEDGAIPYTAGPNGVHMGMVIGIPATVDLTAQGLTAGGLMLARALQLFGAVVTDTGGSGGVLFYAEDEIDKGTNTPAFTATVGQMNGDVPKIVPLLRVLTNQQTSQGALTASRGWGTGSTASLAPLARPWA